MLFIVWTVTNDRPRIKCNDPHVIFMWIEIGAHISPIGQVTSNITKIFHFSMAFHLVWSFLLWVLSSRTTEIDFSDLAVKYFQRVGSLVSVVSTHNKTDQTTCKAMKKLCLTMIWIFLSTILFWGHLGLLNDVGYNNAMHKGGSRTVGKYEDCSYNSVTFMSTLMI